MPKKTSPKTDGSLRSTERSVRRDMDQGLRLIYGQADMDRDLAVFEHVRPWHRWLWRIWSVMCLLGLFGALGFGGWSFFHHDDIGSLAGVRLSIEGPRQVTIGKEEAFVLHWVNDGTYTLRDVDMRLAMPAEFVFTNTEPAFAGTSTPRFVFKEMLPQASGEIRIKGVFLGQYHGESFLQVLTHARAYLDEQVKEVERVFTQPISYETSVLRGDWQMPPHVLAGDVASFTHTIRNLGNRDMVGLTARFTFPDGFLFSRTSSSAANVSSVPVQQIPLGTIAAGSATSIHLFGVFTSTVGGDQSFRVSVGYQGIDGRFIDVWSSTTSVPVIAADLALRVIVNGSQGDRVIRPGDPLAISVGYQNISPETLRDISLEIGFESLIHGVSATGTTAIDWRRLEDLAQGVSSTRNRIQTLRYTAKEIPDFASLASQAEGTIRLHVPTLVAPTGTKRLDLRDVAIAVHVRAMLPKLGQQRVTRIISARPLLLRYGTDVEVKAEARYFTEEGAPLGTGPLPPVVGKSTRYRVFWTVQKTLHPLKDVKMVARLPTRVAWDGVVEVSQGLVSFTTSTREMTWLVSDMNDQNTQATLQAVLTFTPDPSDIGRFAPLMEEGSFDAMDERLEEPVHRIVPSLTTDLLTDEYARQKGVVRSHGL